MNELMYPNSSFFYNLESDDFSSISCGLDSSISSLDASNTVNEKTNKRKRIEESPLIGCDLTVDEEDFLEQHSKKVKVTLDVTSEEQVDFDLGSFDTHYSCSSVNYSELDVWTSPDISNTEELSPMEVAQKLVANAWFTFDDKESMCAKMEEIKTTLTKIEKFLVYFNGWLGLNEQQLLASFLVLIDRIVEKMGRQPVSRYFDTFIVITLVTCKAFSEYKWKMGHFKSLWESVSGWDGGQTGITTEWWEYAEIQAFEVLDWNVIVTSDDIQNILSKGRSL